jgi:two-component system cell cycle response regulator DivK
MDLDVAQPAGTVLIVEDNEMNLKLARELLRIDGFSTIEAVNGTDGVALARARHPDVVVMDVQLPDLDGWGALRQLRDDPETTDLVVVAVTAFATAGDEARFLAGGFDGYLPKPIEAGSFARTIREFYARGHLTEADDAEPTEGG